MTAGLAAAIVDAFTDVPFAGNPAGLVLLDDDTDDRHGAPWMQAVAAEFGQSETAFLTARGEGSYDLRWFTPTVEVALCGHATLAAAHWLWGRGETAGVLRFRTASGTLHATRDRTAGLIGLDFPLLPAIGVSPPCGWRAAFAGADLEWVGRTGAARDGDRKALLVTDAATLRRLTPDFARVARLPFGGVVVTARSDVPDADVLTRYFAPASGIDEDPVTGSAHCTVGWYWSRVLEVSTLRARQVSARGGDLLLHIDGERVQLSGRAVTVAQLELLARPVPAEGETDDRR